MILSGSWLGRDGTVFMYLRDDMKSHMINKELYSSC